MVKIADIADRTWRKGFFHLTVDGEGMVSLWDEAFGIAPSSYVEFPLTKEQQELLQKTMDKDGYTP